MTSARPTGERIAFEVALPAGYDLAPVRAFHGRDPERTSEFLADRTLTKGVMLGGVPTRFDVTFQLAQGRADCVIQVDGAASAALRDEARRVVDGLLGLRLDPAPFAAAFAHDPAVGALALRQPGLRIIQSPSPYEALTWAIRGQQINVAFAVSLRRTFIELTGRRHSSGLHCYPVPADVARLPLEALTTRQFSRSKAETILRLSTLVADGTLALDERPSNAVEAIGAALLAVKGIGPWTVNYGLLRGYAHADASLHGDVAVRTAIGRLRGLARRPTAEEAAAFLAQYAPHRTMAAAHLWSSLDQPAAF